ncbi:hypothetical protein RR48_03120 [Papilio machaon]|uniref:Uncharacterized protein n=1 Tax=Papilio machaon TaxID=76193 RepID=A0A0N0PCH4_PAPMA|nr:hypothetical protein RR48_03120 [Papilio machaon]
MLHTNALTRAYATTMSQLHAHTMKKYSIFSIKIKSHKPKPQNDEPPEITYCVVGGEGALALHAVTPTHPMPPQDELDAKFAELVNKGTIQRVACYVSICKTSAHDRYERNDQDCNPIKFYRFIRKEDDQLDYDDRFIRQKE